jgi:hypothetical protein
MAGSLDSVRHKIFRAQTHFAELQAEIHRYFQTNPGKVVRKAEGDPNQYIGTFQARGPIPARLPIIIGDCLQNLRSSLDYLVWELVLATNNEPGKHNMFPVCSTLEAFNNQVLKQRRLDGVAPDADAEIKALQPYHEGQDFDKAVLWVTDDLCNINKHRRLLVISLSSGMGDIETKTVDGQLFIHVDFATLNKNAKIGPFPIVNGPSGRGLQVEMNSNIVAFVAFNEGAAQNMEVNLVLNGLLNYVSLAVLPRFERFFV